MSIRWSDRGVFERCGPRTWYPRGWVRALGATLLFGCVPNEFGGRHASRVEVYRPAPFAPAEAAFARPSNALGPPDGRTVAVGRGSFIILRFFRPIEDGPNQDVRVYEVGADEAMARAAFSVDGRDYIEVPEPVSGVTTEFDLGELGLDRVRFVRIRGLDERGPDPGFDLDSVEAIH